MNYNPRRFPINLPHHYEDIFHEPNGVTRWGDNILCAVPKEVILMHKQEETETRLNKQEKTMKVELNNLLERL